MGEKKRRLQSTARPGAHTPAAVRDALRLFQTGHEPEARRAYRALLSRTIEDPDTLHRLAYLAIQFDEHDRAEALLRVAVSILPGHPWYCNTLGIALRHQRRYAEAIECFQRALAGAPEQSEIWSNLGNVLREEGRFAEAASAYRQALKLAPGSGYDWSAFAVCLKYLQIDAPVSDEFRRDLVNALVHPSVSPSNVARAVIAVLKTNPPVRRLIEVATRDDPGSAVAYLISEPAVAQALEDPLLLRLLESTIVVDVELELLLTELRRHQLLSAVTGAHSGLAPETVVAIARQCFLNEYAWFETADETQWVASMAMAAAQHDAVRLATLAAYRPLSSVTNIESAKQWTSGRFADLLRQQVTEPEEERRIRDQIPSLTGKTSATSTAVRHQYEANPYPRWSRLGFYEHARPVADVLAELFPGRDFRQLPRSGPKILIAGCGTGSHAIGAALRFVDSHVVAFDLSLASLAYAVRKTREIGLKNIEYRQADIMAVGASGDLFDIVECVGVLHHLRDPTDGWRRLLECMTPDGAMHIGLYSELARRHIVHGQAFAASFASDAPSLRRLRRTIIQSSTDQHLRSVTENEDFFSLSGCRDLLLHVQEKRFNLLDVAETLRTLQLELLGFELHDPRIALRYRERFPDDAALTDLGNWNEFERSEPDTFLGMYDFWVRRRKDG